MGQLTLAKISGISLLLALLVLALKWLAYQLTDSVALYSDALESIINVVTALTTLLALRFASLPADSGHPYGHTKAEYLSAVVVGVLIVCAAVGIFSAAWPVFFKPRPINFSFLGIGVNILAGLLNAVWAYHLLRISQHSPALQADARHILSDVWSSLGVLAGVALAIITGINWLDPALAVLVALHILYGGWQILRDSIGGLLDASIPAKTEQLLKHTLSQHATGALEIHDLKTRSSGRLTFVEFHLVVSGHMTVNEAHAICDRLEAAIHSEVDNHMRVTIHVEPQDEAKQSGVPVLSASTSITHE